MTDHATDMNLDLDETHQAVDDLAHQILDDRSTPERLKEVEAGDRFDRSTWLELAKAGLVGIAVAEAQGGGGLGLVAAGQVARAVGRHASAVPLTPVAAVLPTLASAERHDLVAAILDGNIVVVPALDLGPDPSTSRRSSVRATPTTDGWTLDGDLDAVAFGAIADHFVVPATTDTGDRVLALVEAGADGLERVSVHTTALLPSANLGLASVEAASIGDDAAVDALVERVSLLNCRVMSGVCQGALALAAAYTSEREQFGSKIGTFQAVAHRLADAYIDGQAIELTGLQAVWRADAGLDTGRALAGAAFWACEGGQRIVHAAQHVHGGIGVDTDYPLHRHFRWAKEVELQLGGASRALVALGADLAHAPAT